MNILLKKGIAECLGTFVLVFFACGTAIVTNNLLAIALAFGLVIVAMAYSIGNVSGCHINPAVSLGMLISKKMTLKEFGVYVLAQVVGATIGAVVLYGLLKGINWPMDIHGWGTNGLAIYDPTKEITAANYIVSFIVEVILTFVFVYAILGITSKKESSKLAGLGIGFTLTLVHLIGINLTGTSVNPARSFGPALMQWIYGGGRAALEQVWVFILAPLAGAALAAILFKWLQKETIETE